jgi:hypothetical protein
LGPASAGGTKNATCTIAGHAAWAKRKGMIFSFSHF